MDKPKKKRPGEGDRERRPSKYGEGGRAVGGQARRAAFKKVIPQQIKKPIGVKDVPEPGAQPDFLLEEAKAVGKEPPKNSAFNKLKQLQASINLRKGITQNTPSGTSGEDPTSPDILEELFPKVGEKERPIQSREERKKRTKKQVERRPILRIATETEDDLDVLGVSVHGQKQMSSGALPVLSENFIAQPEEEVKKVSEEDGHTLDSAKRPARKHKAFFGEEEEIDGDTEHRTKGTQRATSDGDGDLYRHSTGGITGSARRFESDAPELSDEMGEQTDWTESGAGNCAEDKEVNGRSGTLYQNAEGMGEDAQGDVNGNRSLGNEEQETAEAEDDMVSSVSCASETHGNDNLGFGPERLCANAREDAEVEDDGIREEDRRSTSRKGNKGHYDRILSELHEETGSARKQIGASKTPNKGRDRRDEEGDGELSTEDESLGHDPSSRDVGGTNDSTQSRPEKRNNGSRDLSNLWSNERPEQENNPSSAFKGQKARHQKSAQKGGQRDEQGSNREGNGSGGKIFGEAGRKIERGVVEHDIPSNAVGGTNEKIAQGKNDRRKVYLDRRDTRDTTDDREGMEGIPEEDERDVRASSVAGSSVLTTSTTTTGVRLSTDLDTVNDRSSALSTVPKSGLKAPEKKHLPIFSQTSPVRDTITPYSPTVLVGVAALLDLPGAICDNCPLGEDKCPKFQLGSTCYYEENMEALPVRDRESFLPLMEHFAQIDVKRATRAVMIEQRATGQVANDPAVTRLIDKAQRSLRELEEIKTPIRAQAERSITVIAKESGPTAPAQKGNLIQALMSSLSPPKSLPPAQESNIITIEPEHVSVLTDN